MIDYIACVLVRGLNILLSLVPIGASLWLGRRVGSAVFFFNRKRRMVAYSNLKSAFASQKSPSELRAITKRVYQNMAQTFVEVLQLTKVNKAYVDKYVEVVNYDRIVNASKSGRGTILLTAHFGDWELSSLVSSVKGFPISVLVREQKMKRLNELLNRLRESNGCKVIRKGMEVKNLIRALKSNEIVGVLSDQDAGRNGAFVELFGRPTSCHDGPFEIAKRTGSLILPNFIVRTHGPYHKLYLEEYIDLSKDGGSITDGLRRATKLLEDYAGKYPDQWLWLHKRWKSTTQKTVLVLDDGKAGHLNQSLAVANAIAKARTTQGYGIDDTKVVTVRVKYKSEFSRLFLAASASVAGWRCHGRMWSLKACLDASSYDTLMKTYCDFVVSCGSGLSAVNIFMSLENDAKNVVVMKPGIFMGSGKFSLIIAPRHDRIADRHNIVRTVSAPNMIDGSKFAPGSAVGLLVGGDNPEFAITRGIAEKVLDEVLAFCGAVKADLLVTTSRRTPADIDDMIKKRLSGNDRCKKLVIANESNPPGTVNDILDKSKVVIVSGESVSMVSEAASSGKRTIVFGLEKRTRARSKHERALDGLARDGYISTASPDQLRNAIESAWSQAAPAKKLDDATTVFEAVRRII